MVPDGGTGIITAERQVPLEGAVNFRDLGGYRSSDGLRVKWGRVFRSDGLARLTTTDQAILRQIGIRLVCDFRTPGEVEKSPDRLPDGARWLHLPIVHGEFDSIAALERMGRGDISWLTDDFMVNGYIRNIDEIAETWGTVLNHLSRPEGRPMVFHCTGGKDRAGVCAALILLALDVPEETVIYDHGLSNIYIAKLLDKIYEYIRYIGIDPEKVAPYFTAPRECIVSMLNHLHQTYGSATNYLNTRAGVSQETLALLKQGDYGRADVPMLPNVSGEMETRRQILLYTVLMVSVSFLLAPFGLGEIYLVSAVVLNAIFVFLAYKLYKSGSKHDARLTFFYSLWYLFLIFGAMVVDRMVLGG